MKNKRVAIYARYTTAGQNPKSIEDQVRECREAVERAEGIVVAVYPEPAKKGSLTKNRDKYNQMLEDMAAGKFDCIYSESMSRLSRDQESSAKLYKLACFYGCEIITTSEGKISEIHIAMCSTINSVFLKNNADQVMRTLAGRVRAGKFVSRPPYGYRMCKSKRDENGEIIRGLLEIVESEAAIVHRIFEEYAAGKSPRQIAKGLNKDGIKGPRGKAWRGSVIRGNLKSRTGLLNNELYRGWLVWNKSHYSENPVTEQRIRTINPESEWVREKLPKELVVVSENLWLSVKARQQEIHRNGKLACEKKPATGCRRIKYLCSAKMYCGECGCKYTLVRVSQYGCMGRKSGGLCTNARMVGRLEIEKAVLRGITEILLCPELVDSFATSFKEQYKDVSARRDRNQSILREEIRDIEKRLWNLNELAETGKPPAMMLNRMHELEAEKTLKESQLTYEVPVPAPDKGIITAYREKVLALTESIYDNAISPAAMESIRPLIDRITLYPDGDKLKAVIEGDILDLLNIDKDRLFFLDQA